VSESVPLLVASLYAETIEAVKLCAALLASTAELISNLRDIYFRGRVLKPIPFCEFFNKF
jgi:hypothetical protein